MRAYLKVWLVGGALAALMLTGIIGSVRDGNYLMLALVAAVVGLAVLMIVGTQFRLRALFRDKTPERLIAHYYSSVRRIPHADAAKAYLSALAASAYGDFDRAGKELDTPDWSKAPALYRAQRSYALAMVALLEAGNRAQALELAAEGREIEEKGDTGGPQVIHDVIQVAAGAPTVAAIERLGEIAKRSAGLVPVLCAWALAGYYERQGREDAAAGFRTRVMRIAPNCRALLQPNSI